MARRRVVAGAEEVRHQVAGEEVEVVAVHLPEGLLGEEGAVAGPPNLWSRDRLSTNCLLFLIFILFSVLRAADLVVTGQAVHVLQLERRL